MLPEPMVAPSPSRSSLTLVMVLRPPMDAPGPMERCRTVSTLGPMYAVGWMSQPYTHRATSRLSGIGKNANT